MSKLAIIDEDAEHERARYWRVRIMLLKTEQLADLVGWSFGSICKHERGETDAESAHWRKYKNACAALHARKYGWQRGRLFEWKL